MVHSEIYVETANKQTPNDCKRDRQQQQQLQALLKLTLGVCFSCHGKQQNDAEQRSETTLLAHVEGRGLTAAKAVLRTADGVQTFSLAALLLRICWYQDCIGIFSSLVVCCEVYNLQRRRLLVLLVLGVTVK